MGFFKSSHEVAQAQACQDLRFFDDLRSARRAAGLSVEDIARRLGWPVEKVNRLERERDGLYSDVRDYAFACETVVFSFVVPWSYSRQSD